MNRRRGAALLTVLTLVALALGVTVGGAAVSLPDIGRVLGSRLLGLPLPENFPATYGGLIWEIRLPRVVLAFAVGGALAASGAVMQSALKNPLASPYTVGVSAGAGLGAAVVIACGLSSGVLGMFLMPAAALLFGLAAVLVSLAFAARDGGGLDDRSVILMGMVMSLFTNALMTALSLRDSRHAQQILLWQTGSFALKGWATAGIVMLTCVVGVLLLTRRAPELDLLAFGDETAAAAGMEVRRIKGGLIFAAAAMTGVAVAFAGVIGFVDFLAPHVVRRLFGASHKYVLPLSALFGGCFLVVGDLIARTVLSPSELPVGVVTALIGAPVFAYIFLGRRGGDAPC